MTRGKTLSNINRAHFGDSSFTFTKNMKPNWLYRALLQNSVSFATGPEFCTPKGFQNTSLVCWQLKTEGLQLPL
jgi:hypothetical protein